MSGLRVIASETWGKFTSQSIPYRDLMTLVDHHSLNLTIETTPSHRDDSVNICSRDIMTDIHELTTENHWMQLHMNASVSDLVRTYFQVDLTPIKQGSRISLLAHQHHRSRI